MTTATILIKNKKEYSLFYTNHDGYKDCIMPETNKILKSRIKDKTKKLIEELDLEEISENNVTTWFINHCYFVNIEEKIIIALR